MDRHELDIISNAILESINSSISSVLNEKLGDLTEINLKIKDLNSKLIDLEQKVEYKLENHLKVYHKNFFWRNLFQLIFLSISFLIMVGQILIVVLK